jgi:hypothetical protein
MGAAPLKAIAWGFTGIGKKSLASRHGNGSRRTLVSLSPDAERFSWFSSQKSLYPIPLSGSSWRGYGYDRSIRASCSLGLLVGLRHFLAPKGVEKLSEQGK